MRCIDLDPLGSEPDETTRRLDKQGLVTEKVGIQV